MTEVKERVRRKTNVSKSPDWERYNTLKKEIELKAKTPQEYDRMIKQLCKDMGV